MKSESAESTFCGVCGCVLSKGDKTCPVCAAPVSQMQQDRSTTLIGADQGAVAPSEQFWGATGDQKKYGGTEWGNPVPPASGATLEQASPPFQRGAARGQESTCGRHAAPPVDIPQKRKRTPLVIGISVVSLLVLAGLGFMTIGAWNDDQALKDQAEQVGNTPEALVESRPTFTTGLGNKSGALAGGGVVAAGESDLYVSLSDGILRDDLKIDLMENDTGDTTFPLVTADSALYLNYYQNSLYYLLQSSTVSEDAFSGTEIKKIDNPSGTAGPYSRVDTLYRCKGKEKITSLALQDGWLYFVVNDGTSYVLFEKPCDGSSEPKEIERRAAWQAWVFVESDQIYFAYTTEEKWNVVSKKITDETGTFKSVLEGTGCLYTACLSEGVLYYSLKEGDGVSHLYRKTIQGEFSEYQDVSGVIRISVAGNLVAVITQQGGIWWLDAGSALSHDLTYLADINLTETEPRKMGLSVHDEWVCVRDDHGRLLKYSVNLDDGAVYGKNLDEIFDETNNQLIQPAPTLEI